MASSIHIPKSHLIMALCLPLAVLLGYFLADPMESASMGVIIFVLAILSVPILMKWYHPLLILSWNAWITPDFLPGKPPLWMLVTFASLLFAFLNRSVKKDSQFLLIPSVIKPLVFLFAVVAMTAMVTGGFGFRALGGDKFGGKFYFYLFAAILGYFAFTSQRIPAKHVPIYLALFFLPAFTGLLSNLTFALGPSYYFLFHIFPPSQAQEQIIADLATAPMIVRFYGISTASLALFNYLIARYGIAGCLQWKTPLRTLLLIAALAGGLFCGFRSVLILIGATFIIQFFLEGLHRTRLLPALLGVFLLSGAIVLPVVNKLPWVVQRTLSFLPGAVVNPVVKDITATSTEWRVDMWRAVLPMVPQYFFKGKGYILTPQEVYMMEHPDIHFVESYERSMLAGEYHSGPFSILIPFGVYGGVGFAWFVWMALRILWRNYKLGDESLKTANSLILAAFLAKLFVFLIVFGSFYTELFVFTGLLGLGVSLNGVPQEKEEPTTEAEALPAFPAIAHGRDSA